MADFEQPIEYVYDASTGSTIWSAIFQSAMVTCTSIFTVTVLVGLMVAILLLNPYKIIGLLIPVDRLLRKALWEDEDSDDTNQECSFTDSAYEDSDDINQEGSFTDSAFDPMFTIKYGQDTPMPSAFQPVLKQPRTGQLVDMQAFTFHEMQVLELLIEPSKLNVSWEKVAGLEELINEIKEQVIFPIRYSYQHTPDPLLMPPKGILLYGPPGCGKTLIAKALSYEIQAHFINFDISTIMNMWSGEREKMTSALFSVARKLEPCIIFIDEVDSFLSQRGGACQAPESRLKASFLQLWDDLTTDNLNRVVVLAASNRKDAIDEAILRRLPLQLEVPLPQQKGRLEILKIILNDCDLKDDVDLEVIASKSEGFSWSDLQEVCRHAATYRLVEYYKNMKNTEQDKVVSAPDLGKDLEDEKQLLVDPIRMFQQFKQLSDTGMSCDELCQAGESSDCNISELISKDSQASMLSSFTYQHLPVDISLSLLANELEDMGSEEGQQWDLQEGSEDRSAGERQNRPIDIVYEFNDLDDEEENQRQVFFRSPEIDGRDDADSQNCSEDNPFKMVAGIQSENVPIWDDDDSCEKKMGFHPSIPSGYKKKSKLRPISMSDLLRALIHSRKATVADFPNDMNN